MNRQRFLRASAGAALLWSATVFAPAALAQVNVSIGIGMPPPAPIYEAVPAPRAGYMWMPGYWDWDDHYHKHAWKQGRWAPARPGYVYEAPRWVQGSNGWILQPERWNRGPDYGRYRRDDDDDQGRGHRGYHCPPGHAKKGEC